MEVVGAERGCTRLRPGTPITSTHQIHCNERAVPTSPTFRHSLRARERLPPQHSVTRAKSHTTTTLRCLCAGLRAQDPAYITSGRRLLMRVPGTSRPQRSTDVRSESLGSRPAELRIPRRDTRRKYGLGGPEVPAFLMSCGRSRITKQRLQATPMPQDNCEQQ